MRRGKRRDAMRSMADRIDMVHVHRATIVAEHGIAVRMGMVRPVVVVADVRDPIGCEVAAVASRGTGEVVTLCLPVAVALQRLAAHAPDVARALAEVKHSTAIAPVVALAGGGSALMQIPIAAA